MSSDHAIVIGCSFAGIGAARVLSERFKTVTIIERDVIPDEWAGRKGVPQSPHVHGIPKLGRELLEGMLPGFVAETQRQGAILFDQVKLGAAWGRYGWSARGESKAVGYGVRRALLEHVARQMLLALPGVTMRTTRVDGLLASHGRVSGVQLMDSGQGLEADLVVDASGKGRASQAWLEAAGFRPPQESTVNGFVGYASRWLRVPEEAWPGDFRYIGQLPTPSCTRGGILYPQDNGLYVMSLFGHAHDYPPSDEGAYLDFLKGCATPLLHDVVSKSEPVSPISTTRSTANRRRHYERLPDQPAGFVAVGDAVSAFNPIFGQGISSGLKAAVLLGEALDEYESHDAALPGEFQRRLAAWLDVPWGQATGYDFAFPTTVGERPTPAPGQSSFGKYIDVLAQLSTVDPLVAESVLVANQSFDLTLLRTSELNAKAEAWVADRRMPPVSDPAKPPALVH